MFAFDADGTKLTIKQRRGKARVVMWVLLISTLFSVALQFTRGRAVGTAPKPAVLIGITVVSLVLLYLLLGIWVVDLDVVVDRSAKSITMSGSKWPFRKWRVERAIADAASVAVVKNYVGRGSYMYRVYVRWKDGSPMTLAAMPAFFRPATLREQAGQLGEYLGVPVDTV